MTAFPAITRGRPLIVVDADEVVLRFLAGLEAYLPAQGLFLDLQSYQLTGNIRRISDGAPLDQPAVTALLTAFHASAGLDLAPVKGAPEALADLAQHAQIVVLTNIAQDLAAGRLVQLLPELRGEAAPLHLMCPDRRQITPPIQALRRFLSDNCARPPFGPP